MSNVFTASNDLSRAHLLARFLRHAWAAYWRWQMRRATVRLLHSLDDRMLTLFSQLEAVNNVFWRRSLKNASRIKGGTFGRACSVDLPSFSATNLA
jgi:hypothetical protein